MLDSKRRLLGLLLIATPVVLMGCTGPSTATYAVAEAPSGSYQDAVDRRLAQQIRTGLAGAEGDVDQAVEHLTLALEELKAFRAQLREEALPLPGDDLKNMDSLLVRLLPLVRAFRHAHAAGNELQPYSDLVMDFGGAPKNADAKHPAMRPATLPATRTAD